MEIKVENKIEVTIKKEINVSNLLDKVEKLANESKQRSLFVKMDYEIVDEIISCLKYIDEQKKDKKCYRMFSITSSMCIICEKYDECKHVYGKLNKILKESRINQNRSIIENCNGVEG